MMNSTSRHSFRRPIWMVTLLALSAALAASGALSPVQALQEPTDVLYIYSQNGIVQGRITPNATYTAEVKQGTVRKKLVTGKASSLGDYSASLGYNNGVSTGGHNGDTVIVTDKSSGRVYTQRLQLIAVLDERTGTLMGTARPHAKVSATLAKAYYAAGKIAAASTVADAAGHFRIDWLAHHTPEATVGRPPWTGYTSVIDSRDVTNQGIYRSVQTGAPTLSWTSNQGGGGYFNPGDAVVHELWNGGQLRDQVSTVVNADGIPRSTFAVDVIDGDLFRTRYHDTLGLEQAIDLHPWLFTAGVDFASRTVSGITEPGAPVSAMLENASGHLAPKTRAAADGSYTLQFTKMEAGARLQMYRVADEGFTGIGIQGLTLHIPILRVNDLNGEVTGYGAPGVAPATVSLSRGNSVVATASDTTGRNGAFSTTLAREILPGDSIGAITGSFTVPALSTGTPAFTAYRRSGVTTAPFEGTAPAGYEARVASAACVVAAVAASDGSWKAPSSCAFAPTDLILETSSPTPGANAGSFVGRYQWVTSPDVSLSAPSPDAVTGTRVTMSAAAFDHDDNRNPAEVQFFVDGRVAAVDTSAPYSATFTLTPGAHRVWAVAVDSLRRVSGGKAITGSTPIRDITVR